MGSDETALTILGGPRVIDVFDGNGAPSGPNCTLFSGADRPLEASRGRSGVGRSPIPHAPVLGALKELWKPCQVIHGFVGRTAERIGRNMLEAAAYAV